MPHRGTAPHVIEFQIDDPRWDGERLDRVLAEHTGLPRNRFKAQGATLCCDGRRCKLSRRVQLGSWVSVELPEPEPSELIPEEIELQILYENERVLVIDKPAGLVVHPGAGNPSGTLANALAHHLGSAADRFETPGRPGIVHRLDKETSGVLVAAKDPAALEALQKQFRNRSVEKQYLALTARPPQPERGEVHGCITRDPVHRKRFVYHAERGRAAHTSYRTLRRYGPEGMSLVALWPRTGRTHQLRVHLQHLRAPIIGDALYGGPRSGEGMMLHAFSLSIVLPDETRRRRFRARLPQRMRDLIHAARTTPDRRDS